MTEGLPVSSSGHLALLTPDLRGRAAKDLQVALHAGTLLSALLVMRRDVLATARSRRRTTVLAAATVPAAVAGALGADRVTTRLGRPPQVAGLLAGFGVLLALADRRPDRGTETPTAAQWTAMALAQVVALAPGVSRLGAVLTAARLTGMSRAGAARAAVLLGIPVTAGAVAFSAATTDRATARAHAPALAAGAGTAAVTGVAALLALFRVGSYTPLAAYRCAVAAAVVVMRRLR